MEHLPKGKYYVTIAGEKKLRDEFTELEAKRGEVAGNIRTARAFGDLSENFEYHEAKREQGFLEGRLAELGQILPEVYVVRPQDVPAETISFGSVVTVRDEDGDEDDFFIVGPLEADPIDARISYLSPLGEALVGRKVGDTIETKVPAGIVRYEIISTRPYEP